VSSYILENFGCRATQADGASIERELLDFGLVRSDTARSATLAVINSCTVTASADANVRAKIRHIHRENPDCKILVTGCYAQRAPEELSTLPGVQWVVGNSHKSEVARLVTGRDHAAGHGFVSAGALFGSPSAPEAVFGSATQLVGDIFAHTELMAAPVFESAADSIRTRPNLKVQDGCDNRCSFCIIPFVRGQSRSLKLESVLQEVDALVAAGYREIVISGINLGRWGRDFTPQLRFEDLVAAILERTKLERLRISSVEPMDWSDELIQLVASSQRICKHAHVPLQSGSDRVLRMMHRKYRPWHHAEKIRKIHEAMPDAAIGADVMVGFPGETDEMFEENRSFIEHLPFTYLHVFTYSSRPGTAAAKMPDHIPSQIARERNKVLRELIAEKNLRWRQGFIGKTLEAITLHANENGTTEALTNNFVKLQMSRKLQTNTIASFEITALSSDGFQSR
jgi:threonylcarbamoyladenosine tRNA methylthiotransferase MtaB